MAIIDEKLLKIGLSVKFAPPLNKATPQGIECSGAGEVKRKFMDIHYLKMSAGP